MSGTYVGREDIWREGVDMSEGTQGRLAQLEWGVDTGHDEI